MKKTKTKTVNKIAPRRPLALRFGPTAWAKLLYLRDVGETEIGGFGITPADDLLYVEDIRLVKQLCTWVHVEFDDQSVADFFDSQVDAGRRPAQFGRIWIHTHPGSSPQPSGTDEATFARVFGGAHWALMFILARGGESYARLRFNVGPGGEVLLPVEVDYSRPFAGSDIASWQAEYEASVSMPPPEPVKKKASRQEQLSDDSMVADEDYFDDWWSAWGEYSNAFDEEEPCGFIRDF